VDTLGRFDTDSIVKANSTVKWRVADDPGHPLPLEIFMRDYYEPGLLPNLLSGKESTPLPAVASLAGLNRNQPAIGEIAVVPDTAHSELVTVRVKVSSATGQCLRDGQHVPCESGVYDLRLYRDGQLVAQKPIPSADAPDGSLDRQRQQWRATSVVKDDADKTITASQGAREVAFPDIRLPQRQEVAQVGFTAYAFNEDRVKSATSPVREFPLPKERKPVQRRAFLITMGVDVTSDPAWRLSFAPNGANRIEKLLTERLPSFYKIVPVPLLSAWNKDVLTDEATKGHLQAVLRILSGQASTSDQELFPQIRPATPDDLVVLYIASHGYVDPRGTFYVIPSDVGEPNGVSEARLNRCLRMSEQSSGCREASQFLAHAISSDELTQWLKAVDAGEMVLILDSCHSAAVTGPRFRPGPMGDRGFGQLSYDKRMRVLAATQSDSSAWGSLQQGDLSILTMALTQSEPVSQTFSFQQWLSQAAALVPELYTKYIPNEHQHQNPALFDFAAR
jgi:hypothetical protein